MVRFLAALLPLALLANAAEPDVHQQAVAKIEAKDFAGARTLLRSQIAAEPSDAEAHFLLGVAAEHLGDVDDAVHHLEEATRLQPKNSHYVLELGGAYGMATQKAGMLSKFGLAKKCCAALERAVELDPNNLAARQGLITYYRQAPSFVGGGRDKAYQQAEEIKKRDPIAGAAVLGQLYLSDDKVEQAFATFAEALKNAPSNYALLFGIGRAAAQSGQHLEEGARMLSQCLHITPGPGQPGYEAVHWRLGNIAEKRGDFATARAEYEEALKINPHFKYASESLAGLKRS